MKSEIIFADGETDVQRTRTFPRLKSYCHAIAKIKEAFNTLVGFFSFLSFFFHLVFTPHHTHPQEMFIMDLLCPKF